MTLLADLDGFFTEHRACGELDAGVDDVTVWLACECKAAIARRLTKTTHLTSTAEPPHDSGMDRRRFLLTSVAGVLAVPLDTRGAGCDRLPWNHSNGVTRRRGPCTSPSSRTPF